LKQARTEMADLIITQFTSWCSADQRRVGDLVLRRVRD
jgi:hypothetical protein